MAPFIHQDAKIWLLECDKKVALELAVEKGKGHFLFMIEGNASVGKRNILKGDAALIDDTESYGAEFKPGAKALLIES